MSSDTTKSGRTLFSKLRFAFGIAKRHLEYRREYHSASQHWSRIARLSPFIESAFDDDWVAAVDLRLRPHRGTDEGPHASIFWDAPVAVRVFHSSHGEQLPALCMALRITADDIVIDQLQGIRGIALPQHLRNWPLRFVQALQTFAKQENFVSIRVVAARSRREWWDPTFDETTPADGEQATQRLRERLKIRYDRTVKKLGFCSQGKWFVWSNPNLSR